MDPDETELPPASWEDARDEERSLEGGYTSGPDRALLEEARQRAARASRGPRSYVRPDERIRDDVCERLFGNTGADAFEVTVEVASGVVTLTGSVPEEEDRRRINAVVPRVLGVTGVDDRLALATPIAEERPAAKELEPAGS